jgi:Xaa-Pro aminopeptidase
MGTLVVSHERPLSSPTAATGRRAEAELTGSGIRLVKIPTGAAPQHLDWLASHVASGGTGRRRRPGARPRRDAGTAQRARAAGITLRTDVDCSRSWPTAPACRRRASTSTTRRSATRRADKLGRGARSDGAAGATHHFVSTVDDVAWITNLRGADVDYNPVFLAHLLLDAEGGDAVSSAPARSTTLARAPRRRRPSRRRLREAAARSPRLPAGAVLLIDPRRVTSACASRCRRRHVVEAINPSTLLKSRKTRPKPRFVREAMARTARRCARSTPGSSGARAASASPS